MHLRWNRPEKALADFEQALGMNPRLAWALYGRGVLRLRRGDAARGRADIAAARAIEPRVAEEIGRFGIKP
jgi:tetratricopeptide (TPR) repeat protein